MNVLFYIEPLIQMDNPLMQEPWLHFHIKNIIESLQDLDYNFYFATNSFLAEKIKKVTYKDKISKVFSFYQEELKIFSPSTLEILKKWYYNDYSEEEIQIYKNVLIDKFCKVNFDIIITFSPIPYLEEIYPKALILHYEYGMFSRKPFPTTYYLDPIGIGGYAYLDKFFNTINESFKFDERDKKIWNDFLNEVNKLILSNNPFKEEIEQLKTKYDKIILLPLQFNNHYLFDFQINYKSQFEYLEDVLIKTSKFSNIGILVTQHPSNNFLNLENLKYFRSRYSNFIYLDKTNDYSSVSPLLVPFVDGIITVSTAVGYYALLWNKKLITLGKNYLEKFSDSSDLSQLDVVLSEKLNNEDKNKIIYWLLTHYFIPENYIKNSEWLNNFLLRKIENKKDLKVFYDEIDTPQNVFSTLLSDFSSEISNSLENNYVQIYINFEEGYNEKNSYKFEIKDLINIRVENRYIKSILFKFYGIDAVKIKDVNIRTEDDSMFELEKTKSHIYYEYDENIFYIDKNKCLEFHVNSKVKEINLEIEKCIEITKEELLEKVKIKEENFIDIGVKKIMEQLNNENRHLVQQLSNENKHLVQQLNNENKYLVEKLNEEMCSLTREIETMSATVNRTLKQKMILKIAPLGTKRRFFLKLVRNALKNPKIYLKFLNIQNIKKAKEIMKLKGVKDLEEKLDSFDEKRKDIKRMKLEIFQKKKVFEKIVFEKFEEIKVSIIIPVYNQWEYTYNCLASIKKNTEGINYEIILIDDVSDDETVNISKYIENITVVRNKSNMGFLKNCNHGARLAKGKYIHFLNNDTNVQKNWLSSLLDLIELDEKIGIVGSKLVYPDGILQEAGGIVWKDASGWNFGRMDDPEKPEYNYVKEVDYISGASIMIKKELWNDIKGFDERYVPAYCEDSDLAFEVRKRGYKVMYQPFSCVVHFEGKSNGIDESKGIKKYQVVNKEKFLKKWKEELKKQYENGENVFLARDRSQGKKTILVVDHYVPTFDKDAGSRTVFQYLKLFLSMGYNVKFIGDNFYRDSEYTPILQQLGIEVLYGNWYFKNWKKWIKDNHKYINICFLNRPHISKKYIDFLKEETDIRIVYYGHDLHFLREEREYELFKDKKILESSQKIKQEELDIISKADLSYYPSEFEIKELKKINENFNVKILLPYMYETREKIKKFDFEKRKNLLFVGGFNHKPNYDAILWFLDEIFPKIIEKNSEIKVIIVGSNMPNDIKEKESEKIIIKGFVSDEELLELYKSSRLVIVPLRYGAGIKGKVIEAFYNGVPVITTNVGIEGMKNASNVAIIANTSEEFSSKILEYYNDNESLIKLSEAGIDYVNNYFSKNSAKMKLKQDFENL